ncbi:hypothetical protein B0T26DRAFT_871278 [Lasiosphaeria miniovina]|uniref:Nudix hydrolase domain-containing protein n=1 Tax=Lasiosphaeria miniovina TaxID=1954250 RepID=A0AA40AWU6_9PEZI|nr:uncharacterized protein B0T26DRAFT_871278 [Lasiosphaeria miniovina]KAK0723432.1 hypothetical protein B0T26DRAFT_871278 [Lasiosphaeria miniovina]
MAKLTELSVSATVDTSRRPADGSSGAEGKVEAEAGGVSSGFRSTDQHQMQIVKAVQNLIRRDLGSLEADDYVINGTVQLENHERGMILMEDPTRTGGDRFDYRPARIKLDTGSRADFVTREYLARIGFDFGSLIEIPEVQQEDIEGLDKAIYKPTHRVNLPWYRQGEAQSNLTRFLVVDSGPFDLLLSSRRFAEEAERRLFSLPLVGRPRKTKEQIDKEITEAKRKLNEAKELEAKNLRAAIAMRNQEVGLAFTVQTPRRQPQTPKLPVQADNVHGEGSSGGEVSQKRWRHWSGPHRCRELSPSSKHGPAFHKTCSTIATDPDIDASILSPSRNSLLTHPLAPTGQPYDKLVRAAHETYLPSVFEIPGGKVDESDPSVAAAVVREEREETGLRPMCYTTTSKAVAGGGAGAVSKRAIQLNYVVAVEWVGDGEVVVSEDEHAGSVWAAEDEVQGLDMTDEVRGLDTTDEVQGLDMTGEMREVVREAFEVVGRVSGDGTGVLM